MTTRPPATLIYLKQEYDSVQGDYRYLVKRQAETTGDLQVDEMRRKLLDSCKVGDVLTLEEGIPYIVSAILSAIVNERFNVTLLLSLWQLYIPKGSLLYIGVQDYMVGILREDLILRPLPSLPPAPKPTGWLPIEGADTLYGSILVHATGQQPDYKTINEFEGNFLRHLREDEPFVLEQTAIKSWFQAIAG